MNSSKAIVIPLPSIQPSDIIRALHLLKKQALKSWPFTQKMKYCLSLLMKLPTVIQQITTPIFIRKEAKHFLVVKRSNTLRAGFLQILFSRIHPSYLVNVHDITAFKKQSHEVEINNQLLAPFRD
jgi:hypothetical protein